MLFRSENAGQLIAAVSTITLPILVFSLKRRSWVPVAASVAGLFLVLCVVQPVVILLMNCAPWGPWFGQHCHGCYVSGVYYGGDEIVTALAVLLAMTVGPILASAFRKRAGQTESFSQNLRQESSVRRGDG